MKALSQAADQGLPAAMLIVGTVWLAACSGTGWIAATPTTSPDPVAAGRQVYQRACAECHGPRGEGRANELRAPALDDTGHAWHHPDQQIHNWIRNGKLALTGGGMPPLGEELSDDEIDAVIAYLHTLWTQEQLEIQQDVTSRYPATPEGHEAP